MKKLLFIFILFLLFLTTSFLLVYNYNTSAVNGDNTITITIEQGSTFSSIGSLLEENELIKSEFFYKIYIKINSPTSLQAGPYELNQNMSVEEIIEVLSNGNTHNPDAITITFNEGLNMRSIAQIIEDNTTNTYEEVFALLEDNEYLNDLIEEYWFITDEILNDEIYYPLEGYLFPNTYSFSNDEISIKSIFETMLNEMEVKLFDYKEDIMNSDYTFHELITMASIVELEAAASDDRAGVAGVFYNRLEDNWSLGSDVTTYYAEKIDMSDRDLYVSELNDENAYNTRSSSMAGKLPVGAICNPGLESIKSSIYPSDHSYFYFVADINKETYFTTTYSEHLSKVEELQEAGLWYYYD